MGWRCSKHDKVSCKTVLSLTLINAVKKKISVVTAGLRLSWKGPKQESPCVTFGPCLHHLIVKSMRSSCTRLDSIPCSEIMFNNIVVFYFYGDSLSCTALTIKPGLIGTTIFNIKLDFDRFFFFFFYLYSI